MVYHSQSRTGSKKTIHTNTSVRQKHWYHQRSGLPRCSRSRTIIGSGRTGNTGDCKTIGWAQLNFISVNGIGHEWTTIPVSWIPAY